MALKEEDTEERLYRLREENYALKKQASSAGNNVKILTSKLGRLLEEKKRLLKKEKARKEVSLEETIKDLELQISTLACENQRLRERELLLRTKLDHNHHLQMQRSPYAHVKSRTDSGLGDHFSAFHNRRLGPHNRSMSSISLNRVTFTATATSADRDDDHDENDEDSPRLRRDFPRTLSRQHEAENHNTVPKKSKKLQRPCTGKRTPQASPGNLGNNSVDNFILQLFRESQQEIIKLRELLTNYQQSMPNITPNNPRIASMPNYHEPIENIRTESDIPSSNSDNLTMLNRKSDQVPPESSFVRKDQAVRSNHKMIQVFDHVEKSLAPPSSSALIEENLSLIRSDSLPVEVTKYIEKLTKELSEAQETVKNMEKQAIIDRSINLKLQEYEQKIENLKNEKISLQKSLDECIGTCVNGIIKESWDDDSVDGANQSAMDKSAINQCSQECVERIEIMENQIKSQQEQYKLLESKYQKLETLYNLLIDRSSPVQITMPICIL